MNLIHTSKLSRILGHASVCTLLIVSTVRCGSDDDTPPDGTGGSDGSGGSSSGGSSSGGSSSGGSSSGGSKSSGGSSSGGSKSSGGSSSSGGTSSGGAASGGASSGGSPSSGGSGTGGSGSGGMAANGWAPISPQGTNGISGVVVNRLDGTVHVQANNAGMWKSTNQGGSWTRVDGNAIWGLAVMGPALDIDQNNPVRIAAWSLEADNGHGAGWTLNGTSWSSWTQLGRNWDFGSTDWASSDPKVMMGTWHESGGKVFLSPDGGVTWDELQGVIVRASGVSFPPPPNAMVGVMDATTLIYCDGAGIFRSTNSGGSFNKVSDLNPQTRVPVLFDGVHYMGGAEGLIVSDDKGATWERQGSSIDMWVGPYFGADADHMMITNRQGVYLTSNGGDTWTKVAELPADTMFDPQIFGGYAWDPIGQIVYAAATTKPLMKLEL